MSSQLRYKIQNYAIFCLKLVFLAFFLNPLFGSLIDWSSQDKNPVQINPLIGEGEYLLKNGQYQQSIECFKRYLELSVADDHNSLACYWNLSLLFWNIDKLDESKKFLDRAYRLASSLNVAKKRGECETSLKIHKLFTQAIEYQRKLRFSQSNQSFLEANRLARSIKSEAYELKILKTWSINYSGDASENYGLDLNMQALQLARSLKHKREVLNSLKNIGSLLDSIKNDYLLALSYYFQALSSARDLRANKEIAFCLSNIASLYSALGDHEKSIIYYSEALKILKPLDSPSKLSALFINIGLSYQNLFRTTGIRDYSSHAIESHQEAFNMAIKANDELLKNLSLARIGNINIDLKQYKEALKFLQPALEIAQKRKNAGLLSSLLGSIGMIYFFQENCSEAESYLSRALNEARKTKSDPLAMRPFYGLAQCREKSGDYGQAISNYNECLRIIDKIGSKIVDDINQAGYFQDKAQIYQKLINLYYKLFQQTKSNVFEKEIFTVAEKAKARSFIEYLARTSKGSAATARKPNPEEEKLKASRLDILKKLSSAGPDPEKRIPLERRLGEVDDALSNLNPNDLRQSEPSEVLAKSASLNTIQNSLLKNDTAMVEYILGSERSFLIFMTGGSHKVIELPPQDKIADMMTGYMGYLENPEIKPAVGIDAAGRIYKELFFPVEGLIPKSVTNLIIVPDGILFHLPFETLVSHLGKRGEPIYLAGRYLISYAPSASALYHLSARPRPTGYSKDLLAFGAPSYPNPVAPGIGDPQSPSQILLDIYKQSGFFLSPIPSSLKEVQQISRHFKPNKKDVYIKAEAGEKILKSLNLNNYRIIHFACHAFSDEAYPLRSALVLCLGNEGEEDGFFQVREMYKTRLEADLTVLSACQTGKGKNIQNEGILGLPRVFFYMGSRSVISTLWSIHDKATSQFMKYFYEYYAQGQGKARALQSAKQRMMKTKYSHPFYWGAFILTGEN